MSMLEDQEKQVLNRLKEAREKAQLSQLELSYRSGVSQNMITNALNITPAILFADSSDEIIQAKAKVIELVNRYMN